ncbi:M15 family metallopeptidase [Nocardioides mangrovi]|uniref:M15 family metallopeptidase n=1 Tax=Nocardioides mangrovi TaxID=2874580 RepID=A0ABS7UK44_9ACTN|nr:M15 family metallopeptidase [Nocardioides mangrovi]MBZ5741239.1 M15 family metallopeptidase [Nocardioides mangrovi]
MRLARALGTAALMGALTASLTACDGGGEHAGDPASSTPPTDPGASASGSPTATASVLDPAHAVDPPGKRTGAIAPADIVVNGAATIPQDRIDAIEKLEGVQDVEQISLASIPIENRTIRVAAVDPATYRNWVTKADSAQADTFWQRVAGGELAIRPGLVKRSPIDKNDYLALGSTDDAVKVHVGAYSAQSWLVDAVVNDTYIDDLGMTEGNALLIRTGGTAPEPLRKPIEKILKGTDTTVSMTDAVARYGLDPGVVQTAVVVGTIADAVGTYRYTVLGGGHIAPDPAWVASHITTETVPILGNVTCNKLIFPQLKAALQDVQAQGLADKIHPSQYAGCYYPRFIAGTTTLSNHAFGLALDINAVENQRGTAGQIDRGVVAIFKHWGFTWGGDWHYTDPMHFEMNQLVRPG